jgi:hypothetical protein
LGAYIRNCKLEVSECYSFYVEVKVEAEITIQFHPLEANVIILFLDYIRIYFYILQIVIIFIIFFDFFYS